MTGKECDKFLQYVYCTSIPYCKNDVAANNSKLKEFAKRIVEKEDSFILTHKEPSHEQRKKHLTEMLKLVLSETSEGFPLVQHIRAEIENQDMDNQKPSSYYDTMIRIRTVFDVQ